MRILEDLEGDEVKIATLVYKCRLCGQKFDGVSTESTNALYVLNYLLKHKKPPPELIGWPITPIEIHADCQEGKCVGVGDIVGYKVHEG